MATNSLPVMTSHQEPKCCDRCFAWKDNIVGRACLYPQCECHNPGKGETEWEARERAGEVPFTPRWKVEAKYPAILQVVLAANKWDDKYPLLEKLIDGLLSSDRERVRAEVFKALETELNNRASMKNGGVSIDFADGITVAQTIILTTPHQ